MTAWIGGRLLPLTEARVSVLDHGVTVGNGVFETLRVYGGRPFAWTRHLARLRRSAEALGLEVPDGDDLLDAARAVLTADAIAEGRLRITVTGGIAPPGSGRGDGPHTAIVVAAPLEPAATTTRVAVVPWTRNEQDACAGLKTTSYAGNVRALALAVERGASEAIFGNTVGNLCEGTGSNVFVVRDGTVATPPAAAGCLLGVTRDLVLERAAALGLPATEAHIPLADLTRADEAFLTSTTREVQGIAAVDGHVFPAAPGPITGRLAAAFTELVASDPDP
ncbi:MAG: aminotransferase class IV [Actinomycetota bacterium]